jgi:hypothetical protein
LKIEAIIRRGGDEGMKWNLSEKNQVRGGGEKLEKYVPELFVGSFYII